MPQTQPAPQSGTMTVGDLYYLLFRHKWKILVSLVLGILAAGAVYFATPAVYESEAALMVRYVSESAPLDPAVTGERIISPGRGGENVINSEIAILWSRDLVEKVMEEMGVTRFTMDATNAVNRALLAQRVMSALNIQVPKNSNIIRITYSGMTASAAQEFLKRLTDAYLLKHVDVHRAAGAYEFLSQQTDQLRSKLAGTEEELRKVKYAEGIVSIDETKRNIAMRIEELTKGLNELETTYASARARNEVLKQLLTEAGPGQTSVVSMAVAASEPTSDAVRALRARLAMLRQKEDTLLVAYTPESIPVRGIRDQIAEARRLLEGERALVAGSDVVSRDVASSNVVSSAPLSPEIMPALVEDQANMAALQAKITIHKELLKHAVGEAKRVDGVESTIVQLQRSRELQEANYKYFSQSLERARIDEALNSGKISNISVVQPATLPAKPQRPNLARHVGIALLLGVLCGLGLAMAQEYFLDHTIRKPSELPAILKVPVLISMPRLKPGRLTLAAGAGRSPLLLSAHNGEDAPEMSEHAEARAELRDLYDALRDRLLTLVGTDSSKRPYLLGVTGCAKGSGVSTIATGLALALARNGDERVVLLDANTESAVPTCFGVNPASGLVEMIPDGEGNTTVAQHSLYVVPSGETGAKPVFASPAHRYAALFQHLRDRRAGFVIVDLPPVKTTSLALRIGRLLDGVLLVIASEKVSRHAAEHAKDLLVESEVKLIGSILNKRRQYVPEWLYSSC